MLHALEAAAQRHESACGTGGMIWRVRNKGGGTPRAPVTLEKVRDKQAEVRVAVIAGAGPRVAYEAAPQVNALLREWLPIIPP